MSYRVHRTVRHRVRHWPLRRGLTGVGVLLPLAPLLAGCSSYRPIELTSVAPGEEIRVVVRDERPADRYRRPGADALFKASAVPTFEIEGDLVRLTSDSLTLSIWIGRDYLGTPFETVREEVALPRSEVVRVERRTFSRGRTALLVAGVTAAIVVLIDRIGTVEVSGGSGDDGPPRPPVQEGALIPR